MKGSLEGKRPSCGKMKMKIKREKNDKKRYVLQCFVAAAGEEVGLVNRRVQGGLKDVTQLAHGCSEKLRALEPFFLSTLQNGVARSTLQVHK